ncbi:MAG: hypothetical protein GC146_00520 [Limimaricola sp.]|nr:hypothetical protein [Limimaricola sp.]
MKKRVAVQRDLYLEAVKRQEHRTWAFRTDPRSSADLLLKLRKLKNQILVSEGKDPEPLPDPRSVEEPDPAVFDTVEQIRRDDALIAAYLAENPDEHRLPSARGHSHEELLKYWRESPEGRKYREHFARALAPKLAEIRSRVLSGNDDVSSGPQC